jgi:uncharacterized cofD-like protein
MKAVDDAVAFGAAPVGVRRRDAAPALRDLKVVALGGGTGVPVLLRGLKDVVVPRDRDRITAIITIADDGGSSGRLRRAYGSPAPGDVRNSLVALAAEEGTLATLFDYRFEGAGDIGGHSLGNLILSALTHLEGGFSGAVARAAEILATRGRVLPSSSDDVSLSAELADGRCIDGESRIAAARHPIRRVRLQPETARAVPEAVRAIEAADLVVIGPGSLYTSLIPVLLVRELAQALVRSHARILLVTNLMTEPGETDGHSAADCVAAIRAHAPEVPIHDVLLNTAPIPTRLLERYAADGSTPICIDVERLRALGCRAVQREVLGGGTKIRHDSHKLARAVVAVAEETHA